MYRSIKPGQLWLDTKGEQIQAHGACVYYENGTYYWIGEDKTHTRKKGKIWTWGIKMYSSKDLCNWTDEGHIIEPTPDDKKSIFHPNRRMDRPHILKNEKTDKYVLWLKYCDKMHASVLTADNLKGPYTIVEEKYHPYGTKFGDFDLAKDEANGQGYLFFEADHDKVIACRLSEDYCHVEGEPVYIYKDQKPPLTREGITHMVRNGKHYILSSGMTGYVPNPSEVAVADDFLGPYTVQGDPHVDDESSASFNSQISGVFKIEGKDQYIAIADRWVPHFVMTKERYGSMFRAIAQNSDRSIKASFKDMWTMLTSPIMGSADTSVADYVWLPIEFEGDKLQIRWRDSWMPEV